MPVLSPPQLDKIIWAEQTLSHMWQLYSLDRSALNTSEDRQIQRLLDDLVDLSAVRIDAILYSSNRKKDFDFRAYFSSQPNLKQFVSLFDDYVKKWSREGEDFVDLIQSIKHTRKKHIPMKNNIALMILISECLFQPMIAELGLSVPPTSIYPQYNILQALQKCTIKQI